VVIELILVYERKFVYI